MLESEYAAQQTQLYLRAEEELGKVLSLERQKEEFWQTPDGEKPVEVEGFIVGSWQLSSGGISVWSYESSYQSFGDTYITFRRGVKLLFQDFLDPNHPSRDLFDQFPKAGDIVITKSVERGHRFEAQLIKP